MKINQLQRALDDRKELGRTKVEEATRKMQTKREQLHDTGSCKVKTFRQEFCDPHHGGLIMKPV